MPVSRRKERLFLSFDESVLTGINPMHNILKLCSVYLISPLVSAGQLRSRNHRISFVSVLVE